MNLCLSFSRFIFCLISLNVVVAFVSLDAKPGSVSLLAGQRFYSDQRLTEENGFSSWGSTWIEAQIGLSRFLAFEPLVAFSFSQSSAEVPFVNSSGDPLLDSDGRIQNSSIDRFRCLWVGFSPGLRWIVWNKSFFRVQPFFQVFQDFRFGKIEKKSYSLGSKKSLTGIDMGTQLGAGFQFSFLSAEKSREIQEDWGLNDFGLMTQIRYAFGGQWRQGLGSLSSLGGFDVGAGLSLSW